WRSSHAIRFLKASCSCLRLASFFSAPSDCRHHNPISLYLPLVVAASPSALSGLSTSFSESRRKPSGCPSILRAPLVRDWARSISQTRQSLRPAGRVLSVRDCVLPGVLSASDRDWPFRPPLPMVERI